MQANISCIHLFIYKVFKEKAEGRLFIPFHSVREVLRRRLHKIPRPLHYTFLKEMEGYNLIKRAGSLNGKNIHYELTGGDADKKLNTDLSLF
jgi:hypothetical protein